MCTERMKEAVVSRHLDDVHFNPAPKPSASFGNLSVHATRTSSKQAPTAPLKQLPNLNYSIMKDAQLRAKLRELGIPTTGTKHMLEKRHREWLTLWNANCDATHPRSKQDLLRQLNEWERAEEKQLHNHQFGSGSREAQIANKEFDRDQWANKHSEEFNDLIANARRNAMKKKAEAAANGEDNKTVGTAGNGTQNEGQAAEQFSTDPRGILLQEGVITTITSTPSKSAPPAQDAGGFDVQVQNTPPKNNSASAEGGRRAMSLNSAMLDRPAEVESTPPPPERLPPTANPEGVNLQSQAERRDLDPSLQNGYR